jgi:hypothetical protein
MCSEATRYPGTSMGSLSIEMAEMAGKLLLPFRGGYVLMMTTPLREGKFHAMDVRVRWVIRYLLPLPTLRFNPPSYPEERA